MNTPRLTGVGRDLLIQMITRLRDDHEKVWLALVRVTGSEEAARKVLEEKS